MGCTSSARYDEVFTTEGMVWSARHVFGVEPIEIETGHTPQLEAPGLVAELLEDLADRPRPAGRKEDENDVDGADDDVDL